MKTRDVINNLAVMSKALEKAANKPENYNTEWAYHLEQMSWSLHRHANELRDLELLFEMTLNEHVI